MTHYLFYGSENKDQFNKAIEDISNYILLFLQNIDHTFYKFENAFFLIIEYKDNKNEIFTNEVFIDQFPLITSKRIDENNQTDLIYKKMLFDSREEIQNVLPPYVGLWYNKKDNNLKIINDYLGLGKIFYIQSQNGICLSSSVSLIKKIFKKKLAIDPISKFASIGWYPGNSTHLQDIKVLNKNSLIEISFHRNKKLNIKIEENRKIQFENFQNYSFKDVIDRLTIVSAQIVKYFPNGLEIGLSGGRDSRLVCALMAKVNNKINFFTYLNYELEIEIAKKISKIISPNSIHSTIDRTKLNTEEFSSNIFIDNCLNTVRYYEGMFEPSFLGLKILNGKEHANEDLNYSISGAGGELAHGHYYSELPLYKLINLNEDKLIRIVSNNLLTLDIHNENTKTLILSDLKINFEEAKSYNFKNEKLADWFYLTERLRRWSGIGFYQDKYFAPLCDFSFISSALSQNLISSKNFILHQKLIELINPELNLINYFSGKNILKKTYINSKTPKSIIFSQSFLSHFKNRLIRKVSNLRNKNISQKKIKYLPLDYNLKSFILDSELVRNCTNRVKIEQTINYCMQNNQNYKNQLIIKRAIWIASLEKLDGGSR